MILLIGILLGIFFILFNPIDVEAKTFENERYTFEYPSSCKLEKKENRFTSADGDKIGDACEIGPDTIYWHLQMIIGKIKGNKKRSIT